MKIRNNVLVMVADNDIVDGKFVVPEGVTGIGNDAFCGCKSLTEIHIPDRVTSIGDYAFYGCESLTEIHIPEGVTSIGDWVFCGCESLKEIHIPDRVTSIGDYAFYGCESLTEIHIPEGVTSIGNDAFSGCKSLKEIHIPDRVTSIGNYAFYRCKSLTEIHIPEGVTSIGDWVFCGCKSLKEIHIPEGVTSIGNDAFAWCGSLTEITYQGEHSVRCIDGYCMEIYKSRKLQDITILDGSYFPFGERAFVAKRGDFNAHGSTVKEAVSDLLFKEQQAMDVSEHVKRVKEQGYVTPNDYRLLTGACRQGTEQFLQANGFTWEDRLPIGEVCKLVKDQFGGSRFIELMA